MAEKISNIQGMAVPYIVGKIDTDELAPTMESLYILDWPELADAFCAKTRKRDPNHVLNDPKYSRATILFTGNTFGCGSSREHAPQAALTRYKAIVAPSYAPIFLANSFAIGLPAVTISDEDLLVARDVWIANPQTEFRVDLVSKTLSWDSLSLPIDLKEFRRQAFIEGKWDERDVLDQNFDKVVLLAARRPYVTGDYPTEDVLRDKGLLFYV